MNKQLRWEHNLFCVEQKAKQGGTLFVLLSQWFTGFAVLLRGKL